MAAHKGHVKAGGRKAGTPNKATRELKEIAGAYTEEAVLALVKVLRESESDAARVSAAKELFDRSHGKAPQAHTGPEGGDMIVRILSGVQRADDND